MSGLTVFFRNALPRKKRNAETNDGSPIYHDSICNLFPKYTEEKDTRNTDENSGKSPTNVNDDCTQQPVLLSYDSPVDWNQWNRHQKEVLTKFMMRRIIDAEECSDDEAENDDADERKCAANNFTCSVVRGNAMEQENQKVPDHINEDDEANNSIDERFANDKLETQETFLDQNIQSYAISREEDAQEIDEGDRNNDTIVENLETQENDLNVLDPDTTTQQHTRRSCRKRNYGEVRNIFYSIPHVSETKHYVKYIADIDLHTREVTLEITVVNKYWKLRDIKRSACVYAPPRKHVHYYSVPTEGVVPQFLRTPYQFCDYDGPIHTCFRSVMPLEITQLINPEIRQMIEKCYNGDYFVRPVIGNNSRQARQQRLMIYLYNDYATRMQELIQKAHKTSKNLNMKQKSNEGNKEQKTDSDQFDWVSDKQRRPDKLLLSFENVPAICVFPYPPADWYDSHDMLPYCLCIGDNSTLRQTSSAGGELVRFDTMDLVINVAIVDGVTGEISEYQIHPSGAEIKLTQLADDQSIMLERYVTYRNYQDTITSPPPWNRRDRQRSIHNQNQATNQEGSENVVNHTNLDESETNAKTTEESKKSRTVLQTPPRKRRNNDCDDSTIETRQSKFAVKSPRSLKKQSTHSKLLATSSIVQTMEEENRESEQIQTMVPQPLPLLQSRNESLETAPMTLLQEKRKEAVTAKESIVYTKLNDLEKILNACSKGPNDFPPENFKNKSADACLVNIFGAVINFKPPIRTKRGDWVISAALVDDSLQVASGVPSVSVVIFAKSRDKLPEFRFAGDVLRLHRVKLQKWNDEIQLLGMRFSSYVVGTCESNLLLRETDPNLTYLPATSQKWEPNDDDKMLFKQVWKWAQKRISTRSTINKDHVLNIEKLTVAEIEKGTECVDATVIITAIIQHPLYTMTPHVRSGNPCGFLRIWDGTGSNNSDPLPIDSPDAHESIRNGDPPKEAIVQIAQVMKVTLPSLPPPKALAGRVTNMLVWEPEHWNIVTKILKVGSFIRLRNVQVGLVPTIDCCHLHVQSKSSITPLPPNTYEIKELLIGHCARIATNPEINKSSGLLPIENEQCHQSDDNDTIQEEPLHSHDDSSHCRAMQTSLPMNFAQLRIGRIGSSFEGLAYVVGIIPNINQIESGGLKHIINWSSSRGSRSPPSFRFALRFCSNQSTNEQSDAIDAIATDKIGVELFEMSAHDALKNKSKALSTIRNVVTNSASSWRIKVHSVLYQNQKFFVLDSIKAT